MNFLAHSLLSENHSDILYGNIITDLCSKKELDLYHESIQKGVILHRKIDEYTDNHKIHREALKLLYPVHKKYSPVILDILWDYFLTKNWNEFSRCDLSDFIENTYRALNNNLKHSPESLKLRLSKMISSDFLNSCTNKNNLQKTFAYLKRRSKFDGNFINAVDTLSQNENALNELFINFFPELDQFCKKQIAGLLA